MSARRQAPQRRAMFVENRRAVAVSLPLSALLQCRSSRRPFVPAGALRHDGVSLPQTPCCPVAVLPMLDSTRPGSPNQLPLPQIDCTLQPRAALARRSAAAPAPHRPTPICPNQGMHDGRCTNSPQAVSPSLLEPDSSDLLMRDACCRVQNSIALSSLHMRLCAFVHKNPLWFRLCRVGECKEIPSRF